LMNWIWGGMLLLGIVFAGVRGNLDAFSEGLLSSCTEAVYFILSLAGIMAAWSGIMNVAKESGLMDKASALVRPLMGFLFPREKNKDTLAMMLMSFTANLFGAGNSATVFSLKAMKLLDEENGGSPLASNEMCMFLAVNMSMLQLVPISVIQLRSDAGSADPGSIIIPSILAGLFSMAVSIAVCKFFERRSFV